MILPPTSTTLVLSDPLILPGLKNLMDLSITLLCTKPSILPPLLLSLRVDAHLDDGTTSTTSTRSTLVVMGNVMQNVDAGEERP